MFLFGGMPWDFYQCNKCAMAQKGKKILIQGIDIITVPDLSWDVFFKDAKDH